MKSIFLLIIILFNCCIEHNKNAPQEVNGVNYYYRHKDQKLQILKLKEDYTFEYYHFYPKFIDGEFEYSQGKWERNNSGLNFKNCFNDSISLDIKENLNEKIGTTTEFIEFYSSDTINLGVISNIEYLPSKGIDQYSNLYLCVFYQNGQFEEKNYDLQKRSFGSIASRDRPVGFYLKGRNNILSKTYYIKNRLTNKIEINLQLDERRFIYHFKNNFLNNSNLKVVSNYLINTSSLDSFKVFNEKIESDNIETAAIKIKENIMK